VESGFVKAGARRFPYNSLLDAREIMQAGEAGWWLGTERGGGQTGRQEGRLYQGRNVATFGGSHHVEISLAFIRRANAN
jgi:hypothetical protein